MKRPICVLAIIFIIIIIGLHLKGVVFLDFDKVYSYMNSDTKYEGIIESKEEKEYKYVYTVKITSKDKLINGKKFILNVQKNVKTELEFGDKVQFQRQI